MFKFYRSVLAAGVVALGLAACGDNVTVTPPPPPSGGGVSSVVVTPPSVTIGVGQTEQLAVSVVADSGVDTGVNWTTGNAAVATVSATGVVTGIGLGSTSIIATSKANSARSSAAQVTVTNAATFAITPNTLSLAPGQSSNVSATVALQAGQTASPVVWTSLTPSIATVATGCTTASGTSVCAITGVSQGSAVITASTTVGGQNLTQTVSVTVGQGASISINSVTAGATAGVVPGCAGVVGAPVILTNTNCQIDVNLNFAPGIQRIDSVTVWFQQGSTIKKLARQFYGGTVPAGGNVTLQVNTANFTKNVATGTATVDLWNGPTTLIAQVWPTVGTGGSAINCQIGGGNSDPTCSNLSMVLTNTDGWAADITKCDSVIATGVVCQAANPAAGTGGFAVSNGSGSNTGSTYWGGPGNTGEITAELYAVVYNNNPSFPAGSALNRCASADPTAGAGSGADCITNVNWSIGSNILTCPMTSQSQITAPGTPFFRQVFGSTAAATNMTNDCSGHENILAHRDNVVVGSGALDAQNNAFPSGKLIPNTVVFASTPDSFRLDYKAPSVPTPDITRSAPQVTGWVNAAFNFVNFNGFDQGVGVVPTTRLVSYTSVNCPTVTAVNAPMPTGTGADINGAVACPTNFIGGTVGLGGTAPWTVTGTEADALGNTGTSGATNTFGTDYTAPAIRWGLVDAAFPLPAAYGGSVTDPVDSTRFQTAVVKVAGAFGEFRAEYLDERSGFFNAGQPGSGTAAQSETLATAGHLNPVGLCMIGSAPVGATFVTNPGCGFTPITVGTLGVRSDGWQPGERLNVPLPEGYYGYKTWVQDEAGNQSATLFRSVLINNQSPFSTGLGVPAILTSSNFNFIATFSDSAEIIKQSLQVVYPFAAATIDSFRFNQSFLQQLPPAPALAAAFDDFITSPFSGNIAPPTGTPYAHSIEQTTGAAFPASNVNVAGVQAKPTKVLAWSWNPGSLFTPGGPAPGVSPEIPIPGLNVESNNNIATFNSNNPTIAITHFRIIATVAASNQFGSVVPLRAQVESPTNAPNPPFARVDFFRQVGGAFWSYLGSAPGTAVELSASCSSSVAEVCGTDQGTYRSWVYQLPGSYKARWDGVAQGTVVSGDLIMAVGVVASGDALATQIFTMTP